MLMGNDMIREFIYTHKFDLFPKDEKVNLSLAEKNSLKQVVKAIGEELKK
jgi:hypothetical protein